MLSSAKIIVASMVALVCSSNVLASDNYPVSTESKVLLEQLATDIQATLRLVAEKEKAAGNNVEEFQYVITKPRQEFTNLGLTVDLSNADNGFRVLSVTPGSAAQSLAIKSNDHVLAINGQPVNSANHQQAMSEFLSVKPGQTLALDIVSGNERKTVSTKLSGQYVPEFTLALGPNVLAAQPAEPAQLVNSNQCGVVSVFFKPPSSKEYHPAIFTKVDGDHRIRDRTSVKLAVGLHEIYVLEAIDINSFNVRSTPNKKPKKIIIDVKANTVYHLGAEFFRDKKYKVSSNEYWQPVIWKQSEKECELD
ncbi:PDZ domain-containing protein [Thalassotalea sp. HSM 43]|uniref:PDZ domain-containing protein n=1 Tax=Thalassotalea sp. HSM 43 TaxID=2552945 RepID=UPI0010804F30|nr:PDZ domain-containing protein [Thalassotalea sp. HSM 43]QBY05396.1 PDZ domain-containing protein [Thalassotalea sp. HSM 43]